MNTAADAVDAADAVAHRPLGHIVDDEKRVKKMLVHVKNDIAGLKKKKRVEVDIEVSPQGPPGHVSCISWACVRSSGSTFVE